MGDTGEFKNEELVAGITDVTAEVVPNLASLFPNEWPEAGGSGLWQRMDLLIAGAKSLPRLVAALTATPSIAPLFEHPGAVLAFGRAAVRVSEAGMARGLVTSTLREALFGEASLEPNVVRACAASNLGRLTKAVTEQPYRTRLIIGLEGGLAESQSIKTPWGRLTSEPLWGMGLPYGVGQFLAIPVTVRSRLVGPNHQEPQAQDQRYVRAEETADRAGLQLGLAFALAFANRQVPLSRWRAYITPGGTSEMQLWSTPTWTEHFQPIAQDDVPELLTWCRLVRRRHEHTLDVAAERLIRARAERYTWEDQLIDAVIAWENVCSASAETTFRVTAGLSKLLEPVPEQRPEARKGLADIYAIRSAVVHGRTPARNEVRGAARAAIDVARNVLRTLYANRPELIPLSADERADRLLLMEP